MLRRLLSLVAVFSFGLMVAACGDTWEGAKEDTADNAEAVKDAVE